MLTESSTNVNNVSLNEILKKKVILKVTSATKLYLTIK